MRRLSLSFVAPSKPDAPYSGALTAVPVELAAIASAGAALGLFYMSPWLSVSALAALVFAVIAFRWPLAGAVWVLWTAPWYRFPKALDPAAFGVLAAGRTAPLEVSVVETALLLTAAAWVLRRVVFPYPAPVPAVREPAGVRVQDDGQGPRSRVWWRGALLSPVGALLLAALVSLPFTANLHVALRELRTVILEPAIFALILRDLLARDRYRWIVLHALVVLAAFVGTQGVIRYLTGAEVTEAEGVWRAGAIYWSPNHLALLLDRLAPVAVALAVFAPASLPLRGLYAYAAAMTVLTMGLTFSRAGWLALGAALLALAAARDRRALVGLAVAGAAAAAVALLVVPVERLLSAATSSQRLWLWQAALAMLRDHPLMGVGLDNFLYAYPQYMLAEAWREPNLSHPHNAVLDFWLRLGILGTFALGWMLGSFARRSLTVVRSADPWQRAAGIGLAAAILASMLHGMVDNSFFLIDLAYMFWTLWMVQDSLARTSAPPTPSSAAQGTRETL